MTKQEEIREGVAQRLFNIRQPNEHFECLWENRQNAWYCEADKLLSYLHSQDDTGYDAIEPIIKE